MKRLFVLLALAVGVLAMSSCDEYDDGVRPSKSIRNQFESMYPNAKDVEWDREGYYWKVSFETGSLMSRTDHEAWYDNNGTWLRTETDMYLSAVPQDILDYLKASEYASAIIEDNDVDYVETPQGNYYKFDVIFGGIELSIKVDEDGNVGIAGIER